MPNWIGDAVMASPIIAIVKSQWPGAKITIMAQGAICSLFQNDQHVSSFFTLDKSQSQKEQVAELKNHQFDFAFILTHSFSSAWLIFRAKIPYRMGYAKDFRKWLLTDSLPYPRSKTSEHMIATYQKLFQGFGIKERQEPRLYLSEYEKKGAKTFLEKCEIFSDHILIGINPSAAFGSSKCWLEERYREVAKLLLEDPKFILLFFGDSKSEEKINRISMDLGPRVFNLSGSTTLRQLMALVNECDLFLTNDSGPMHVACALKTRVLALFGSTSPEATGPYNQSRIIRKEVNCSPCFKRECPIDFRCMKSITVEEVYQTILDELKASKILL
ncbi:MAG: ADP-heptose--LPS heptosyltransferase 2 [Chlamydiae bacterium]|nr:ADP-heptose--LPS heptosyltransferase 2 [Chlamydiota bacterium]